MKVKVSLSVDSDLTFDEVISENMPEGYKLKADTLPKLYNEDVIKDNFRKPGSLSSYCVFEFVVEEL
jgi:hypothetical protein